MSPRPRKPARCAVITPHRGLGQATIAQQPRTIRTDQLVQIATHRGRIRLHHANIDQVLTKQHQATPKDDLPDTLMAVVGDERIDLRAAQLVSHQTAGRHPAPELPHHRRQVADRPWAYPSVTNCCR